MGLPYMPTLGWFGGVLIICRNAGRVVMEKV